jgi:polyisoprenyl-phosphate glycosyltransferase
MIDPVPVVSVVVALRDEFDNIDPLATRLREVLDSIAERWEVILVDDGSGDGTFAACAALHAVDNRFKLIRLSRSFGHQVALSAGLDVASGEAAVTMDGDLQHPPEVIPELVARWRAGAHVVYAVMADRQGESWFKARSARWFYSTLNHLADIDVPAGAGDFRLVDRAALEALRGMPERNRYLRGMFSWIGFDQEGVTYSSPPRSMGQSKYTMGRMMRLASNAVAGFSDRPLRLALNLGFVVSLASILFGLSAIVAKLTGALVVPGWTSVVVLVGIVGGVQLVVMGIIGVYVGHIADEVRRRPLYVIRSSLGLGGVARARDHQPRWSADEEQ